MRLGNAFFALSKLSVDSASIRFYSNLNQISLSLKFNAHICKKLLIKNSINLLCAVLFFNQFMWKSRRRENKIGAKAWRSLSSFAIIWILAHESEHMSEHTFSYILITLKKKTRFVSPKSNKKVCPKTLKLWKEIL